MFSGLETLIVTRTLQWPSISFQFFSKDMNKVFGPILSMREHVQPSRKIHGTNSVSMVRYQSIWAHRSSSLHEMYSDKIDVMTVIPRQTETTMNPAGYLFTCQPEKHAKAVFDQIGYETQTYGVMIHDLEYNLRFKYTVLGLFDKFVQWRNASRNANLVKIYGKRN